MTTGVFPAGKLTPARGGILSVADVTTHPDSWGQWTNGSFGWDTIACPVELILADYCANADIGLIAQATGGVPEGWPFSIISKYACTTLGMKLEERKSIALRQNEVGTQKALERQIWSGAISVASNHLSSPYLANGDAVDVTIGGSGATSVKLGVAALEQGLGDCGLGAQGVIHMSRSAATLALNEGAILWRGEHLETGIGTPVIAGVGYDPSVVPAFGAVTPTPIPPPPLTPEPAPADQYIYATGPVAVHLGPSEIIDAPIFDRINNEIAVLAGRPAAVYWDPCCVLTAHVDLTK
jgi:hypothetical protein